VLLHFFFVSIVAIKQEVPPIKHTCPREGSFNEGALTAPCPPGAPVAALEFRKKKLICRSNLFFMALIGRSVQIEKISLLNFHAAY
jgi:hypothetical protein